MKHLALSLVLIAFLGASGLAQPTNPIQRLMLNPNAVTRIPVATDRLTTIRFPGPVSDLEASRIGIEPHPEALFLLSFQPGHAFFSLRALVARTNATLNVTWKGQTYVLEFVESRSPWLSVVFDPPPETRSGGTPQRTSPSRLLGLLDTAKAFGLLQHQHPAAVAGVEVARPNSLHDYGEYTIRIEEVFRFDPEDTLVFRIGVSNKTAAAIQFIPESLMVRAGSRVFFQSMSDATGMLRAGVEVPIYFAITGSADGFRNNLSPRNEFMVLLNRIEPSRPGPVVRPADNSSPASAQSTLARPPVTRPSSTLKYPSWDGPAMKRQTETQIETHPSRTPHE